MKKLFLLTALAAFAIKANAQATFQRTAKGAQYNIVNRNAGERIKINDVVTFQVIQKTERDSVLFSSYTAGHPIKLQVQPSQNIADLMEVFPLLTAKDSVIVRIPSDSVFKEHETERPPFLPKGSNLVFAIKIEKVQSLADAIAERNAAMEKLKTDEISAAAKYIADNKLAVRTTASGLKYVITRASVKRKPANGDTVLVNYVGRTLNGQVFDTSLQAEAMKAGLQQPGRNYEPIEVIVGQGRVIQGWDEGLLLLNEGSKATFVIPSQLGYGPQGSGPAIGPYSTLVFDMELVKVKPQRKVVTTTKKSTGKTPVRKSGTKTTVKKPAVKKP